MPEEAHEQYRKVLDLAIDQDFQSEGVATIGQYLLELLLTLWIEKESFSGKRPLGDSDWEYTIYQSLVKNDIVAGELDDDGDIEDIDVVDADRIIAKCIAYIFSQQSSLTV